MLDFIKYIHFAVSHAHCSTLQCDRTLSQHTGRHSNLSSEEIR